MCEHVKMKCAPIDLSNVCRTCKSESPEMKSLYYRDSERGKENLRLGEMLMAFASVQVNKDDGLPMLICRPCYVLLKNAYAFKEQCKKADVFLREYLETLKKVNIKEEVSVTDLEYSANCIEEFSLNVADGNEDNNEYEEIMDDPDQVIEMDMDDIQVMSPVHKEIHQYKFPVLSMLDDLDNISEDYIEINYDKKIVFANESGEEEEEEEEEEKKDFVVTEEPIELGNEVSANQDQVKTYEKAQISNDVCVEEDPSEMLLKKVTSKEENIECENADIEVDNSNVCDSHNSAHSQCIAMKQPSRNMKGRRGRSHKLQISHKSPEGSRKHRSLKYINKSYSNSIPAKCPECSSEFASNTMLAKHVKLQHRGIKVHECEICKRKFSTSRNLNRHKLRHLEPKPFVCKICQKGLSRRYHLENHMKLHQRDERTCNMCWVMFNTLDDLIRHKADKHSPEENSAAADKKYECEQCMKAYTKKEYRDLHMKIHLIQKKYQCNTCQRVYASKSYLLKHIKFHEDDSKFLCSECGQRFTQSEHLVVHMRRHRGEKPFKCKFCQKGFPRATELTVHERCHTGEKIHVCVVCGKAFGRAYYLTLHMRTHTGEKPYSCTYCEATFSQNHELKTHIRKHTKERLQCDMCPQSFLANNSLTKHKRIKHGSNGMSNSEGSEGNQSMIQ